MIHDPRLTSMSEREFQDSLVNDARTLGWRVAHFRPAQDRRGNWQTPLQGDPGFPDLVMVSPDLGQIVFAELKRADGRARLRDDQVAWQEALTVACQVINRRHDFADPIPAQPGVYATVWTPRHMDDIDAVLNGGRW